MYVVTCTQIHSRVIAAPATEQDLSGTRCSGSRTWSLPPSPSLGLVRQQRCSQHTAQYLCYDIPDIIDSTVLYAVLRYSTLRYYTILYSLLYYDMVQHEDFIVDVK